MDHTRIIGIDAKVEEFVDAWESSTPYIMAHTSGSTGIPKDIRLLKTDMEVSARATCRHFGITSTSHMVLPLSVDYIAGKMMVVRALVSGAKLTVIPPSRTLAQLKDIKHDIDLLPIVPSQLDGLLAHGAPKLIHNVIIGGAPLTQAQEKSIRSQGFCAYATYGMTETCSHVALRRIGDNTPFEAMPGIGFSVDEDSCLVIHADEYSSHTFHTTDIVELYDARHFRWVGRRDNIINSGGIKIMPEEAESRLRLYFPDVDFFVTSRPSQKWGQEMVMVVANHGGTLDLAENMQRAAAACPHFLLPKAIIQVSEHEYTSTGKLRRILPNTK